MSVTEIIPASPVKSRLLTRIDLLDNPNMREDPGGNPVVDWTKGGSAGASWFGKDQQFPTHFDPGSGFAARHSDGGSGTNGVDAVDDHVTLESNKTAAGVVVLGQTWVVQCAVILSAAFDTDIAIEIELLDAGDLVVQSELANPLNTPADLVSAQMYFIQRKIVPTHADATKFRVRLDHQQNLGGASVSVWSYLTLGMMWDVQPFTNFRVRHQQKKSASWAPGAAASHRLRDGFSDLKFGYRNLYIDHADEVSIRDFLRDAQTMEPFSLYRDRASWLNTADHYRHCVLQKGGDYEYQAGRLRTGLDLQAVAPREWKPQKHTRT